jgi:hypothetical protein
LSSVNACNFLAAEQVVSFGQQILLSGFGYCFGYRPVSQVLLYFYLAGTKFLSVNELQVMGSAQIQI